MTLWTRTRMLTTSSARATTRIVLPGRSRSRSVTYREAAEMLEVTHTTIGAKVKDGRLVQRRLDARGYPSINAASLRAHAAEREADARVREQARREHEERQQPPQDGDMWLSTRVAAAVLGISPARM